MMLIYIIVFAACLLAQFRLAVCQITATYCAWTGECAVPGCSKKCVADLGAGTAATVLYDRAFSETWYALCPRLANVVDIVVRATSPSPPEASAPPTTEPATQIATGLITTIPSPEDEDESADAPEDAGSRTLLTSGGVNLQAPQGLAYRVAEAMAYGDVSGQQDMQHSGHLLSLRDLLATGTNGGVPGASRVLLDGEPPSPPAAQAAELQECPSPETIKRIGNALMTLADEYSGVFQADLNGETLTASQAQLAPLILNKPNEFAVLVSFLRQPERLAAYVRDECTTSAVRAAAFPLYRAYLLNITQPTSDVQVCRDNNLWMEQHVRAIVDASDACLPPFAESPDCHGGQGDVGFTPTTRECGAALAAAYNVTTAAPLLTAADALQSLHTLCQNSPSEVSCEATDGSTQRNTIRNAWLMFPLRAPLPGSTDVLSLTPATPAAAGDDGGGDDGAAEAPVLVFDDGADVGNAAAAPSGGAPAAGGSSPAGSSAVGFVEEDPVEEASGTFLCTLRRAWAPLLLAAGVAVALVGGTV